MSINMPRTQREVAKLSSDPTSLRFAFYGRVSTEDNQDPEASRNWQLTRANALIEPRGGMIVVQFFDIGKSRSLPWNFQRSTAIARSPGMPKDCRLVARIRSPGAAPTQSVGTTAAPSRTAANSDSRNAG